MDYHVDIAKLPPDDLTTGASDVSADETNPTAQITDPGGQRAPALQQWFRTAARYPLLDHAAEIRCHRQMERASQLVLRTLTRDVSGSEYLRHFLARLVAEPPRRDMFRGRDAFHELHRETNQLTESPAKMTAVRSLLGKQQANGISFRQLALIGIPRPCLAAMADHLASPDRRQWSTLARALDEWLGPPVAGAVTLEQADRIRLLRLRRRYLRARDRLVLHNLRLVNAIVMRQRSQRQLPLLDLVQEGCTGLMRAADKYDANTGFRFSTYAYNWVTQAVRRAGDSQHGLIRLPANVGTEVARVYRARQHLEKTEGRPPGATRLAEVSGHDREYLDQMLQVHDIAVSLGDRVFGDSDLTLEGTLADPDADGGEAACEQSMARRTLRHALQRLPERQRLVVSRRWGLEGPAETLEQISARLGVSREWVRQIERQALQELAQDQDLQRMHRELS